jgi:hypothetical protein
VVLTEERGHRAIAIVPSLRPALAGEDAPAAGAYGGVRGDLFVYENFLHGFRSIFEPDGQNAQKQGGKFGGSRSKIFKQSI